MDFINVIKDFANGRKRFEDRDGLYIGMGASSYSNMMVDFIKTLNQEDREKLISIIVNASIGKVDALLDAAVPVYNLLFSLILSGFCEYVIKHISLLEDEFNNEENLKQWIKAGDSDSVLKCKEYKKDWHYGLTLSVCIGHLGSKNIEKSYNRLIKESKSEHFKEALIRNRECKFFADN